MGAKACLKQLHAQARCAGLQRQYDHGHHVALNPVLQHEAWVVPV